MISSIRSLAALGAGLAWIGGLCAAPSFVTNTSTYTEPTLPLPAYLGSYQDPNFNTLITHISQPSLTDGWIKWGDQPRHHYAKTQAWNADMSLLLIENEDSAGSIRYPHFLLLDGGSYRPLFGFDFAPREYRWHPSDPDTLFYTYLNRLSSYNVRTQTATLLKEFTEYPATTGAITLMSEGNLSQDGQWIALASAFGSGVDIYPFNLSTQTKGTVLNVPATVTGHTNNLLNNDGWVCVSPTGDYVVLHRDDTLTEIYDRSTMSFVRNLPTNLSHFDMAIEGGVDIAIGTKKPGANGEETKVPLASGSATVINSNGYSSHTSARNIGQSPGWAIVSYQGSAVENASYPPYFSEVVAVELASPYTVRRLAQFHDAHVSYPSEPHASAAPDGLRAVYASNWLTAAPSGLPVSDYVVDLRDMAGVITSGPYRPVPTDGSHNVSADDTGILAWTPGSATTTSYKVYLSTTQSLVTTRDAGALLGTTTTAFFDPGASVVANQNATPYYWAVDQLNGGTVTGTGPTWEFWTNRGESAPLFFDSFEDTTVGDATGSTGRGWITTGTVTASVELSPFTSSRSGKVAKLKGNSSMKRSIDTRGYTSVQLRYARRVEGASPLPTLTVSWGTDGVNFPNVIETTSATAWGVNLPLHSTTVLASGAENQATLWIKFETTGSSASKFAWIDSVTVDAVPDPASYFFSDDFETSNFSTNWVLSSAGVASRATAATNGGTYGMELDSGAGNNWAKTHSQSTVGKRNIHVLYDIKTTGFTGTQKVSLEWWDGSAWQTAVPADWSNVPTWSQRDVALPAAAEGIATFAIRFSIDSGSPSTEYAYIDNVRLSSL